MIRTREEREIELKVAERERRFVAGLRWRLLDALQQLQREENEILGSLVQTNLESIGNAAGSQAAEESGTDCVRAPRSPRTPPLRPFLELDPMRRSGNPLLPHWRLESEDMPSPPPDDDDFRDYAPDTGGSASSRAEASCSSSGRPSLEGRLDARQTQLVRGIEAQTALAALPAFGAQGTPRHDSSDDDHCLKFVSVPELRQPGSLEDTPSPCSSTTTAETRPDVQRRRPKWRVFRPWRRRASPEAIASPPASAQKRRRVGTSAKPRSVAALLP